MGSGVDEVDYAKQVEPEIERKRRYFSLAIITFTAFTFNLSFSIILTSAKPYLDQVHFSHNSYFIHFYLIYFCFSDISRWTRKLERNFSACSSPPSRWPNYFSVLSLAIWATNSDRFDYCPSCRL
jgi:hypothetical protein